MKQVFISYTTCDKNKATEIRNYLEKEGVSCWMGNRDIPGGANYTKEITTAIRECQVFVLILSKAAQKSEYVFRELDFAVKQKKTVIPYLIEDQKLTDEFYFLISSSNGIHAFEDPKTNLKNLYIRIAELTNSDWEFDFFEERPRKKTTRKYIVCPKCRSGSLRNSISFLDQWIENDRLAKRTYFWGTIILIYIGTWLPLLALKLEWALAESLFIPFYESFIWILENVLPFDYWSLGNFAQYLICSIFALVLYFLLWLVISKLSEYIRTRIHHKRYISGIDIRTFRCRKCNHKFRVKIPIREQDKYYIKDLSKVQKEEFVQKLINLIAN